MPELYIPDQIITRLPLESGTMVMSVIWLIVLLAIGIIVLTGKNTAYIRTVGRDRKRTIPILTLLFVYSVISLSQVSTFIYFNF